LSLDFTRTYSSAGNTISGPLGAGWTENYNVRLIRDDCGTLTVIGGEGSGNTFSANGHTDAATAQLFGLTDPAHALFFDPQVGYHSFLVNPDPNKDAYDFYTTGHIRYHFELEPDVKPFDNAYTLRFIEEPNGNRIDLYYSKEDSRLDDLSQATRD